MSNIQRQQPMFISQADAEAALIPYRSKLTLVIMDAWAEWERIPSEHRSKLNARARANCLSDFMKHYAQVHFADEAKVEPFHSRGLFLLGVDGKVTIRFKKLRYGKKTSNIMTNQQINFNLQLELPGIPKAVRLTVGYILDVTQTHIKDVVVTLWQGCLLMWDFSIKGHQQETVVPLPLDTTQPQRQKKAKVKAKKREEETGD